MKGKSIAGLALLLAAAVILGAVAVFGIGGGRLLSMGNIKLGLDLSGGAGRDGKGSIPYTGQA